MGSKKKDLEIIYNLQWKNKLANGGDKANIIGMYDIPSTTLNWEIFKSYLLKNSGTVGEDVRVSYITDSKREFPIENQTDFQIALYAFRRKSRMGDIVNLKLDRISEQPTCKNLRNSNDVETQFSNEATAQVSTCCSLESPPEWFTAYMSQFKKNITKEIAATVSCIVSSIKPHTVSQPTCYHMRKSKPEASKRIRKLPILTGESSHETKDIIKSLKIEGKLERKLEKLEHKTKKIRDKKLALFTKSSDSEAGPSDGRSQPRGGQGAPPQVDHVEDEVAQMGASPVNTQKIVPHMLGGEVYLHQWEVMNTGLLPWTKQTALLFTWGSKALKPLDTIVPVPLLKPGEIGTLSVRLQIPNYPGQYECYWHFHHKERRFGHWLGCQVIVDQFDLKGNRSVLETSYQSQHDSTPKSVADEFYQNDDSMVKRYPNIWQGACAFDVDDRREVEETANILDEEVPSDKHSREKLVRDLGDLKLQDPTDTNCSSDSDNQSVMSGYSSKRASTGYVVVQLPECFKVENAPPVSCEDPAAPGADKSKLAEGQQECLDGNNNGEGVDQNPGGSGEKGDDACSNSSRKSDIVMVTLPEKGEVDGGDYVFVIVDGKKLPIPKKLIKSEYLQTVSQRSGGSTPGNLSKFSSANSSVEVLNKEELPAPTQEEVSTIVVAPVTPLAEREVIENTDNLESGELHSHCSAAGSCFSDANNPPEKNARLFVFPQDCPGYEVVAYPVDELARTVEGVDQASYTWARSGTQYSYSTPDPDACALPPPQFPTPAGGVPPSDSNPFVESGVAAALEARVDPQPLNLTTGVPPQGRAAGDGGRTPVAHDMSEEPSIPTTDPSIQRESESPNRDFLASERARRPSPGFLRSEAIFQGATTAFNTARSVINKMVPQEQPGKWVNGHWVSTNPETPREANLQALAEMGFWNRDLNATLLARYNDDLSRVVAELVQ